MMRESLGQRLSTRWKWGLLTFLWMTIGYFSLQYVDLQELHWMDQSWEARWIPVAPQASLLYLSYFPLIVGTGLFLNKCNFSPYLKGVWLISVFSFLIFMWFPTGVSRESLRGIEMPWSYDVFISLDQPRNAFPSLHVSLSVWAACAWWRQGGPKLGMIFVVWVLGIIWSTMALRQHVWLDAVSGAFLCVPASLWFHRRRNQAEV